MRGAPHPRVKPRSLEGVREITSQIIESPDNSGKLDLRGEKRHAPGPQERRCECLRNRDKPNWTRKMVEAGGIEPPSENRRAVATTRLFRDLISPRQRPRTGCAAASHFAFRVRAQVADGVSLAH